MDGQRDSGGVPRGPGGHQGGGKNERLTNTTDVTTASATALCLQVDPLTTMILISLENYHAYTKFRTLSKSCVDVTIG